jgi:hypothetical protein
MKTRGSLVVMLVAALVATGCSRSEQSAWAARGGVGAVEGRLDEAGRARAAAAPAVSAPASAQAEAPRASGTTPDPASAKGKGKGKGKGAQTTPGAASELDGKLTVKRLVLAKSVEARAPVGAGERFVVGEQERIYAFVDLVNGGERASEITVSFEREGGPSFGEVRLDVGASPRWRTWAFTRQAKRAGTYVATVRDPRGAVLARQSFTVEPSIAKASVPSS